MNCLPETFGAKPDGRTDSTAALQTAIDRCNESGGGAVVLSKGMYLSYTLQLKSNVELRLEKGAVLQALPDIHGFPELPGLPRDGCSEGQNSPVKGYALLYAYRARNVRLTGSGTIDVGGDRFQDKTVRPFSLRIIECSDVVLEGLTFLQPAAWCCHIQRSVGVTIQDLTIRSANIRNGDGIDIDSSSDVTVSGCDIRTSDDAICLKTTSMDACRNIRVVDCVLESGCSGFKIGTESMGDFSDIEVLRCTVLNCGVVALKITAVDGGAVRNVLFSDLTIQESTGPIFVATGNRGRSYLDANDPTRRSTIDGLTFRRMDITTRRYIRVREGVDLSDCGQGVVLSGCPGQIISNVTFESLNISFWGGVQRCNIGADEIPVLTTEYPECHKLGILPAYGYFFQYAENVAVDRCSERLITPDARLVHVDGPSVSKTEIRTSEGPQ
ncbi:MAG: hypothetical protein EA383_11435 [Spirochaetaceae bacterium]|nr:MAG: hypothetical protein EA383_11435 [Spirochaetaceae bacterium]